METPRTGRMMEVIAKRQPDITVVMENVFDPHNISAVLRTCDAVGIGEMHSLYTEAPPHNLIGFRSSAGSWKWVKNKEHSNMEDCVAGLKKKYGRVYAAQVSAEAKSLYEVDFTKPIAIVFGNEQKGCSAEILSYCDGQIFIPQVGMVQSLNISVACSIILYEAFRQKQAAGHYQSPVLGLQERKEMLAEWTDFSTVRQQRARKA